MAFPTVAARAESATTADAATLTVTFTQTTGDLVVIFVALPSGDQQTLDTVGDSFNNLTGVSTSLHILYKILDGSEGGNVVITWDADMKACAIAYNIDTGTFDTGQAPQFSTLATGGADNNPDPGSLTPTGGAKDYLWIAAMQIDGEDADDDAWCTAAPTGFGNLSQKTTGTGGVSSSNAILATADLAENAASKDPGTFTTNGVANFWEAYTVAIHPVAAGGGGEVFFENRHPIEHGMKPQTASGMGGTLIE